MKDWILKYSNQCEEDEEEDDGDDDSDWFKKGNREYNMEMDEFVSFF